MTLPAAPLTAVVIPHGSRYFLVVHLLAPLGLHAAPGLGEGDRAEGLLTLGDGRLVHLNVEDKVRGIAGASPLMP